VEKKKVLLGRRGYPEDTVGLNLKKDIIKVHNYGEDSREALFRIFLTLGSKKQSHIRSTSPLSRVSKERTC